MRPPPEARIHAPEFPPGLDWVGVAFLRMDKLVGRGAVLLEFFDSARINSHRTLPYVSAWHERYRPHGLRVVGVHSPGYSFGRDREIAERLIADLGVEHPVVLDPDLAVWRLYGNQGWPARYLFDHRGLLRYVHYGEGDYVATEEAIQEVLLEHDSGADLPPLLEPLRPEEQEGVLLEPQTADITFPADRDRVELVRDWQERDDYIEAADAGAAVRFSYSGGGAWAALSGAVSPGLYEVEDGEIVAPEAGVRVHAVQFTPAAPSE